MHKSAIAISAIFFLFSSEAQAGNSRAAKMHAKDVGAMVGLANICNISLSVSLTEAKDKVLLSHPEDFESVNWVADMAIKRDPEICTTLPELLDEFDSHLKNSK